MDSYPKLSYWTISANISSILWKNTSKSYERSLWYSKKISSVSYLSWIHRKRNIKYKYILGNHSNVRLQQLLPSIYSSENVSCHFWCSPIYSQIFIYAKREFYFVQKISTVCYPAQLEICFADSNQIFFHLKYFVSSPAANL